MTKYTGKINGHEVHFEWNGKSDVIGIQIGLRNVPHALVKWITDIKPVEPEQPKHQFKWGDNVIVSDDEDHWAEAIFIGFSGNSHYPYSALIQDQRQSSVHKHCRPLNPEPVAEKEEVEFECWRTLYNMGAFGDRHPSLEKAKEYRGHNAIATYHIHKVKGKDATITKVEGV